MSLSNLTKGGGGETNLFNPTNVTFNKIREVDALKYKEHFDSNLCVKKG